LFVHYPDRYHIITINKKLAALHKERILAGGCSDQQIKEMGVTCTTIPKSSVHNIAVSGESAGDTIILYAGNETLHYILSHDYSRKEIHSICAGVKRTKPSKQRHFKSTDWRKSRQNPAACRRMRAIGYILNLTSFTCFPLGILLHSHKT